VYGQAHFAAINAKLNQRLTEVGTMIAVHRGTAVATVVENSSDAVVAAQVSGADVVEIDVVASSDHQFFAFHDGEERRLLGTDSWLSDLPADHIRRLRYVHVDRPSRPARVELVPELLSGFRGESLFHIDRSWRWWPALLPTLDSLDMTDQLLLKSPAEGPWARVLRAHPVKYPYMPICRTWDDVNRHLGDPTLNIVGIELLADDSDSPFVDAEAVAKIRAHGAFVMVNAEVLPSGGAPLFAGYDDEVAVLGSADKGWGPLFDLGVDVIQTDWPWLLRDYRRTREGSRTTRGRGRIRS
jgi:glycerophosphoryl diester phosphodiesterase